MHFFVAHFVALSVCMFCLNFCCLFSEIFLRMQTKLELFLPEIVSAMKNKELLSHFGVYRQSAASAKTDERTSTDEPLYTGLCLFQFIYLFCYFYLLFFFISILLLKSFCALDYWVTISLLKSSCLGETYFILVGILDNPLLVFYVVLLLLSLELHVFFWNSWFFACSALCSLLS